MSLSTVQVVEQIIEQLSESISQLMMMVITLQEQNAAAPPQIEQAVGIVATSADNLPIGAKQLAQIEYGQYPEIYATIVAGADKVAASNQGLRNAAKSIKTCRDRREGWRGLVTACKDISAETIALLQIVYGAERDRVFLAAQKALDALSKLNVGMAETDPKGFAKAASDAATKANQLAEYLKGKAGDIDSPVLKQEIMDLVKELQTNSKALIEDVNELLRYPDDEELKEMVTADITNLNSAINRATQLIHDIDHEFDDAGDRFDSATSLLQKSIEDLEAANLNTYDSEIILACKHERDFLNHFEEDIQNGELEEATASLSGVIEQADRINKLVQLEAKHVDAATADQLRQLAHDLSAEVGSYNASANKLLHNPEDSQALTAVQRKREKIEAIITKVEQMVSNPSAEVQASAMKEVVELDKMAEAAKNGNAHLVSRHAKAAVRENKNIAKNARLIGNNTEDPLRRRQILDGVDELERLLPHDILAAKKVLENPNDEAAVTRLDKRNAALKHQVRAVAEVSNQAPEFGLLDAVGKQRKAIANLNKQGKSGDAAGCKRTATEVVNNGKEIRRYANYIAAKSDDKAQKASIVKNLQELQIKQTQMNETAAKAAAGNAGAKEQLNRLITDYDKLLDDLVDNTGALLYAEAIAQKADNNALENARGENDAGAMARKAKAIAKRQANLVKMAKAMARRTEDPIRRKQLLDDVDELEMFLPDYLAAVSNAMANPDDEEAQRNLRDSIAHMQSLVDGIMDPNADRSKRGFGSGQQGAGSDAMRLTKMMPDLLNAAERFARNPDDALARKQLLDILEDLPLELLENEDERLATLIKEHNNALNELTAAAESGDKQATAAAAKKLKEAQSRLAKYARGLATNIDDPLRRKRAMDALDELDMLLPPTIASATAVANDPNNVEKKTKMHNLVNRMKNNATVIEKEIHTPPELAISEISVKEKETLKRLKTAVQAGKVPQTEEELKTLKKENEQLLHHAKIAVSKMKNPANKERVQKAIDSLESSMPIIESTCKAAAKNPKDAAAMKKALTAIAMCERDINTIVSGTRATPIGMCQKEDLLLQKLEQSVTGGSPNAAKDVQELVQTQKELRKMIEQEIKACKNPTSKQNLIKAMNELEKTLPHHINAAKAVMMNPNDEKARVAFKDSTTKMRAPIAQLIATMKPIPDHVLSANTRREEALLSQLREAAAKGDSKLTEECISAIAPLNSKIVAHARTAAKGSNPTKQKELNTAADELEQLHQRLPAIAREARSNPNDKFAQEKLAAHSRAMENSLHKIEDLVIKPSSDTREKAQRLLNALLIATKSGRINSAAFLKSAKGLADYINAVAGAGNDLDSLLASLDAKSAERVRRAVAGDDLDDLLNVLADLGAQPPQSKDEETDEPELIPKTWDEMIQKVANDVSKAAGKSNDPITLKTQDIAAQLSAMADAAKAGDRKAMIEAGRNASKLINELLVMLRPLAAKCRDPIVRDRLIRATQAMKTFSTQLKILAAVKAGAALEEQDADTQGQLVACTRSLGKCLKEAVSTVKTMKATGLV